MSHIRELARSHPVLSYYLLVFAISWGGILILVAPGGIPGQPDDVARLFPFTLIVLFAGPSVAGIVMAALVRGRSGLREQANAKLGGDGRPRGLLVVSGVMGRVGMGEGGA